MLAIYAQLSLNVVAIGREEACKLGLGAAGN
jgi:hypothetical protein